MGWYDRIAGWYDPFTAWIYHKPRTQLIEYLKINRGDRILIVACGTGQSFEMIQQKLENTGEIIAVDYSAGMLHTARKRIKKNHWKNIRLLHEDARNLSAQYFLRRGIEPNFDVLIGELAFSVIPDWEDVMKTTASVVRKGGRVGLLDWYRKKNDRLTKVVNYLAQAEVSRDTIGFARKLFADFRVIAWFLSGNVYVGVGENA